MPVREKGEADLRDSPAGLQHLTTCEAIPHWPPLQLLHQVETDSERSHLHCRHREQKKNTGKEEESEVQEK